MRAISLFLIIILLVGLAAVLIGVMAYKRRVSRIENGEVRGTHTSIPAPATTVSAVYKIVLMIIVVIGLINMSAMRGEINSLRNDINNMRSMEYEIYELKSIIAQNNSRLLNYSYEFGDVNYDNKTGELKLSATLKEFTEDTKVTVEAGVNEFELKKGSGGTYTATVNYGLFEPYSAAEICIKEGDKTTVETVDFPSPIFYEYLPVPNVGTTMTARTSFGKVKYDGEFYIVANHLEDIESASLTYMTSNRDLQTIDITEDMRNGTMITVVKGLPVDDDLTSRIEIITKTGFKIIEQSIMIYGEDSENDTKQFTEIQDSNGHTLWKAEY